MPEPMSPEFDKFKIGGVTKLPGSEMYQVPSPQGPTKSEKLGYGIEVKNLLDAEGEEARNREMEEGFLHERIAIESRYAKQDRLFARLVDAQTPQEVAPCIMALRKFEDYNYTEAISNYKFQNMTAQALDNADAYSMTHQDLIDNGIVKGKISKDGFIETGGELRFKGYEVKVVEEPRTDRRVTPRKTYQIDEQTGDRKLIEHVEIEELVPTIVEKPCFLPENERLALGYANRELAHQMIVGQKQHTETTIFDNNRAALEEQVKIFFIKQIGMSNTQFKWFYNAAKIENITPEKPINTELGRERDRAMHMMELIGNCETREKMESFLNNTFALEEILDQKTVDNILETPQMKATGIEISRNSGESDSEFFDRKFEAAAKFLISKNLVITKEKRMKADGTEIEVRQYKLEGWLTAAERDVCTDVFQNEEHKKYHEDKGGKGSSGVGYENSIGVRGLLVNAGNTFTNGSKDVQYAMSAKISILIGDIKGYTVRDADRMFWTRGEKDELGAEIYAFKYKRDKSGKLVPELNEDGYMIPNLPTGEELVEIWNKQPDEAGWIKETAQFLKRFSLPGEPVGSDLSKLYHAYLYSLKDQLKERPTGLLLGVDKFPKMAQSLLSLGRTEVETAYLDATGQLVRDEEGKIVKVKTYRSFREQWNGFKGDKYLPVELPKKLGEINWEQARSAEEVHDIFADELREAITTSGGASGVAKEVWKALDISNEQRDALIEKYSGDEAQAMAAVIGDFFKADDGGVGDNVDGFYKLMNFLAGDGKVEKRPHAYFSDANIDPRTLDTPDYWTGKKKFLQIILGAAGAWGDFRKFDRRLVILQRSGQDIGENGKKMKVRDVITKDVDSNVTKVQHGWFLTVMSHPSMPEWMRALDYTTATGGQAKGEFTWTQKFQTLAKKYGFVPEGRYNNNLDNFTRMKVFPK